MFFCIDISVSRKHQDKRSTQTGINNSPVAKLNNTWRIQTHEGYVACQVSSGQCFSAQALYLKKSKVDKKCLPPSPRTVICVGFLTAENWTVHSLVVHASLAMSYVTEAVGLCWSLWLVLVLCFPNSLCVSVDSWHGASFSVGYGPLWIIVGLKSGLSLCLTSPRAAGSVRTGAQLMPACLCLFIWSPVVSTSPHVS